jgi:mono/diheme cytochrome c family protein
LTPFRPRAVIAPRTASSVGYREFGGDFSMSLLNLRASDTSTQAAAVLLGVQMASALLDAAGSCRADVRKSDNCVAVGATSSLKRGDMMIRSCVLITVLVIGVAFASTTTPAAAQAKPAPAAAAAQTPAPAAKGDPEKGKALALQRCVLCHSIGEKGLKGFPMEGVATRVTPDEIRQWLLNPKEMGEKAGFIRTPKMESLPPLLKFTPEQLEDVIAYVSGLKTPTNPPYVPQTAATKK